MTLTFDATVERGRTVIHASSAATPNAAPPLAAFRAPYAWLSCLACSPVEHAPPTASPAHPRPCRPGRVALASSLAAGRFRLVLVSADRRRLRRLPSVELYRWW